MPIIEERARVRVELRHQGMTALNKWATARADRERKEAGNRREDAEA